MFKTIKKFTSCFLVLCMLLSMVPMGVFASGETINYVSIGDSMTNGYCFDGYNQGGSLPDFINDNDNGVYGDAAYPELIADWLEGSYATVNHTRLAPSAMRAEDLLYLLGGRETPADDWYGQVENYTNCYDDAALSEFFTDSVTEADLITMGIGNASFGAFLLQHVTDAIGVMGNAPDIDPDITLANALELIDAEQQDVVMQVYDYMAEELGKYIPADMQATYNIPTVLDITAYTAAGFILNYKNVIERIVELNPDVEIVLVGLMNTTYGMNITADDMPSIPVGDIMDNVFGVLNAYIAGLPTVMQRAGNYSDAKFYYSEINDIEFIVQKFDDLKAANWASIDGLSGTTVRSRTITSYNNSLRGVINSAFGSSYPAINLADVQNFENAQESGYVGGAGMAPDVATSAAIYLAIENALAASVGEMDIPLDDLASIAGDISGIFSGLSVDTTSPATVRSSLATYLSAEEFKPLCKIYSLFKIGDGMSVHPTPAAHAALAAKIISAYENGYTAEDKVIDTAKALAELIAKYGEEAAKELYNYLESEGYIAQLETAIDELVADLENPDSDLSQKLVAETDKLLAILEVETGEELPSGEEVITAIRNYEETLAELEEYIANNEKIQEAIATVKTIVAQIKDIIANPEVYIQNVIDDVVAKYEENLAAATTADYVACGENHYVAFAGTNTSGTYEYEYSYKFGDYIDATDASTHYFTDGTPIADAVDYIESLDAAAKADLESATIVTYQTDVKDIVLPLVVDDVRVSAEDWAALLDVDAEKAAEIKATIIAALKGEYADKGAAALNDGVNTALEIKEEVMSKLPAGWATALAAEGAKADEVIETILETAYDIVSYSLDATLVDMVAPLAEELVFNTVAYLVNNINAVEAIKATNPNALIAIVGLHNPVKGLMVSVDGQVVDLGEYVEYFIEATNVYNTIYAAASENVIFVEADETEIAGYEGTINIDTTNPSSLMQAIMTLDNKLIAGTVVTESGHNYIVNQLKTAITKVNHIDSDNDDVCDKCGEDLAPVTPTPTPNRPGPGGSGGGVASSFTIKFETNGGSKVDDVKVENGKSLAEPAAPTKNGFTFDGWYTDKELTKKYDFSQKVTKSFTLYAKWIEGEFKNPFVDVNEGDWFYDAVMFVLKKGITKGVSETEYAPQGKVTRAQFITMLCRAYEIEEMTGENFADCGNTWYTGYLAAAKQLGISNGVGDNMFAPEKEITREEMVTLIYNYLKSINKVTEETAELSFADSDNVSEWAKTAVAYAAKNGIVNGKGNNIFDPQGTATRAELAQIFYNMFK